MSTNTEDETFNILKYKRTVGPDEIEIDGIVMYDCTYYVDDDGHLHRDNDQPAVISNGGVSIWLRHGKLHRDNDRPALVNDEGITAWYRNGKLHRDNGHPARIYYNIREWWINGSLTKRKVI